MMNIEESISLSKAVFFDLNIIAEILEGLEKFKDQKEISVRKQLTKYLKIKIFI